jgi:hypothetical protein
VSDFGVFVFRPVSYQEREIGCARYSGRTIRRLARVATVMNETSASKHTHDATKISTFIGLFMNVSDACQTFFGALCEQFIVACDPEHGLPGDVILHPTGQRTHLFSLRAPILGSFSTYIRITR